MITFSIDTSTTRAALRELIKDIRVAGRAAMAAGVDAGENSAKGTDLYKDDGGPKTEHLRQNTTGKATGLTGQLVANTSYASFLEYGTKPHWIPPAEGKSLVFIRNGQKHVLFRPVWHPGNPSPRPFMEHAGKIAGHVIEYELDRRLENAASKFNAS